MFDKLDDILMRLEEVLNQLSEPDVAADAAKFQKLMKEQAELQPIADAYKDYKTQKQTIEESLMLLEEESDEEMREMLKEELSDAKKRVEELEQEYGDKYKFGKVNVDENPALAAKFGIMSIPVTMVVENGDLRSKVMGAYPKDELVKQHNL